MSLDKFGRSIHNYDPDSQTFRNSISQDYSKDLQNQTALVKSIQKDINDLKSSTSSHISRLHTTFHKNFQFIEDMNKEKFKQVEKDLNESVINSNKQLVTLTDRLEKSITEYSVKSDNEFLAITNRVNSISQDHSKDLQNQTALVKSMQKDINDLNKSTNKQISFLHTAFEKNFQIIKDKTNDRFKQMVKDYKEQLDVLADGLVIKLTEHFAKSDNEFYTIGNRLQSMENRIEQIVQYTAMHMEYK